MAIYMGWVDNMDHGYLSLIESRLLFIFSALRFCLSRILLTRSRVVFLLFLLPPEFSMLTEADRGRSYILRSLSSLSSRSSFSLHKLI